MSVPYYFNCNFLFHICILFVQCKSKIQLAQSEVIILTKLFKKLSHLYLFAISVLYQNHRWDRIDCLGISGSYWLAANTIKIVRV